MATATAIATPEVEIDRIDVVDGFNARKKMDKDELQRLADTIKESGLVQPISVAPKDNGRYDLVAGHRRLEAAKEAGLKKVKVTVSDGNPHAEAFYENNQRVDLNPIETALGLKALAEEFNLDTNKKIAAKAGKSEQWVGEHLRLLNLPKRVQTYIASGDAPMAAEGFLRPIAEVSPRVAAAICEVGKAEGHRGQQFVNRFGEIIGRTAQADLKNMPTMVSVPRFRLSDVIPDLDPKKAEHKKLIARLNEVFPSYGYESEDPRIELPVAALVSVPERFADLVAEVAEEVELELCGEACPAGTSANAPLPREPPRFAVDCWRWLASWRVESEMPMPGPTTAPAPTMQATATVAQVPSVRPPPLEAIMPICSPPPPPPPGEFMGLAPEPRCTVGGFVEKCLEAPRQAVGVCSRAREPSGHADIDHEFVTRFHREEALQVLHRLLVVVLHLARSPAEVLCRFAPAHFLEEDERHHLALILVQLRDRPVNLSSPVVGQDQLSGRRSASTSSAAFSVETKPGVRSSLRRRFWVCCQAQWTVKPTGSATSMPRLSARAKSPWALASSSPPSPERPSAPGTAP
jgi:ParB family transcriptional regulator, chromosome partitioning protein